MAQAELKTFVEDRLQALIPGIDVSAGSPAQTTFVDPLMRYLGTDPFETDIDKFLSDRFRQEYPDIYAGDPSAIRDLFVKPLITFLEPLKREILTVRRNQSLKDPTVLSDDDADALVANFYDQRAQGALAGGTVRAYYSNPANVPIEVTVRFATAGGLGFFPTASTSITAEEMVFNRDGALYYADIPVKAEKEGTAYNVAAGSIVNVDGLFGVVKVTNLQVFQSGADKISTDAFVSQSREALNERSLLNRRGAVPRLRDAFPGQLRAVQVIGAQDAEMQRDILVGHTKGHTWLTGRVTLYENMALVQARTVDDGAESAPVAGDTLYVYLNKTSWPSGILQKDRFVELTIEETVLDGIGGSGAYQCSFLVRWSGSLPTGITTPLSAEGGCARKGTISITSIPGIGAITVEAPDRTVHVYGHTDIYVRPSADVVAKSVLSPVVDASPIMEYTTLSTANSVPTNWVMDAGEDGNTFKDFAVAGVLPGDVLYIESGDAAGTYTIADITGSGPSSRLLLTTNVERTADKARYRISRTVKVDLFSPKIPKLPFSDLPANDLTTQIGSLLFSFATNTVNYGVRVGDTVRITSGPDVGDFKITGFDSVLGGRGVLVDRRATATVAGLKYEIFTPLEPVQKPLIRIKEVMLLDSSKKATGVTVPPALPVAVRSVSDFTSASTKGRSYQSGGIVLPKLDTIFTTTNVALAPSSIGDRRYSTGSEPLNGGHYKTFCTDNTAFTMTEMLIPASAYDSCSWFLALVEDIDATEAKPPVTFEVGGVLNLLSGPNKGGYLIKEVVKFRYYPPAPNYVPHWLTFVRIHGEFPSDTFRTVIDFLAANPVSFPGIPFLRGLVDGSAVFEFLFRDVFWNQLPDWMNESIGLLGGSPPGTTAAALDTLLTTDYEVGTPAKGVLRSYFQQPTLFEQSTAESPTPTTYDFKAVTGDILSYRPDPFRYEEQNILPAREAADVDVFSFPRDVLPGNPLADSGTTAAFSLTDKPSVFSMGVRPGDLLELYEEKPFFAVNDYSDLVGVITEVDSPKVTRPASAPAFDPSLGGLLFSIVDGPDAGLYRIIDVPDSYTLVLDRPLTTSTPEILAHASSVSFGYGFGPGMGGMEDRIGAPGIDFSQHINRYVSLYCTHASTHRVYLAGSFRIKSVVSGNVNMAVVERTAFFPSPFGADSRACVVVTDAPASAPEARSGAQSGTGTEVVGVRLARFYQDLPTLRTIVSIGSDILTSTVTVDTAFGAGINNPYRVYRKDVRRVGAMEMSEKKESSLYYFDTEVISLSPSLAANIPANSYLVPREGTFVSNGYKHIVDDRTLTYSTKEEGKLELPLRIIPPFSADRLDNALSVPGASLQITYDMSTVVESVQTFIGSVEDRVTAANMLARHFLPSYASYDATYLGGSSPDVIAKDIISYIESLPVETPLDVSVVQDLIANRGGNLLTPSAVVTIMHDWSRRMWMEMSQNEIGGTRSAVPYDGSSRVTFFVPGADISLKTTEPYGERIKLVRK